MMKRIVASLVTLTIVAYLARKFGNTRRERQKELAPVAQSISHTMMPEWRQKIADDKATFLQASRAHYGSEDDTQVLEIVKERISHEKSEPLEKLASELGLDFEDGKLVSKPTPVVNRKLAVVDLDSVITIAEGGDISPMSIAYNRMIRRAFKEAEKDPSFELKLTGKTYGLGARGINVDGVRVFKAKDIKKMLAKINE